VNPGFVPVRKLELSAAATTHFTSVDEQLETLYIIRLVRLSLGQRRDLYRMIHDEYGLDQMLFYELFEEQGQQHYQTVDTVTDTAGRRHTDLQCVHEIFIGRIGFLIACCQCSFLRLETLSLVDGVI
jgi:hypothetical protein